MLSKSGHLFSCAMPDTPVTEKWLLEGPIGSAHGIPEAQPGVEGLLKRLLTNMSEIQHDQESLKVTSAALDEKIHNLNSAVQLTRDIAAGNAGFRQTSS
jgi:hypothetical protein